MCEIPLEKFWISSKIEKKVSNKKSWFTILVRISESTVHLFVLPFRTAETSVESTFPWQEFVLMQPGNYTLELYLQDIGQLATWKGSKNKRHGRHESLLPLAFSCDFFSFFCVLCVFLVGDVGIFCCALCVFFLEKDEGNSSYQKQWDDNTEVGPSIWFY